MRRTFLLVCSLIFLTARAGARDEPRFYAPDPMLDDFIAQALERNPALLETWARYRAALAKVRQVTALPDPRLTFTQFVRSAETRVGPQLNMFSLSQTFPWFGKLDLAGQTVLAEAAAAHHGYRSLQKDIAAEVKSAYYELCYADRALHIARQEEALLEHFERLAQSRYSSGQGLQLAVVKLQAELTRILNRIYELSRQRETAAARINTLRARPAEEPVPETEWFQLPQPGELDTTSLNRLAELHRDELRATLSRLEKGEQTLQLSRLDGRPDFTLSAGFTNVGQRGDPMGRLSPPPDNGKNIFNFSIGVNIPIWRDKYDARASEAAEGIIAERQNYRKLRNEIDFSVQRQVIRLNTLRSQIDLYDAALVPQTEQALRSAESAYATGQLGVLDLLDSQRLLLDIRLAEVRFQTDYMLALTALERAIGTRFPQ